jgi:transposase-like protein
LAESGRPSKYSPDMVDRAYDLCSEAGLTDAQLAKAFGVTRSSISLWKTEHPEFGEAVTQAKEEYDSNVVEAGLLKRARGYEFDEVVLEPCVVRKRGEPLEISDPALAVTKRVRKHMPPDVRAIMFWLKNRSPERWRDKQEIDLSGEMDLEAELRKAEARVDDY